MMITGWTKKTISSTRLCRLIKVFNLLFKPFKTEILPELNMQIQLLTHRGQVPWPLWSEPVNKYRLGKNVVSFVMKRVTTIRGQNAQLPNVKADGTHNYHKAINIYTLTTALSKPPSILKRQIQRFSYQHNCVCVCVCRIVNFKSSFITCIKFVKKTATPTKYIWTSCSKESNMFKVLTREAKAILVTHLDPKKVYDNSSLKTVKLV